MSGSRGKVVVAMSGGVDSSVAACLLREQGYEVMGLFMRTGAHLPDAPPPQRPVADSVARRKHGTAPDSGPPLAADACKAGPDRHRGCCSADDASDARAVAGRLGIPFFALNFEEQFDRLIDYFADEYGRGRTPNPCILCNQHLKFGRLADYAKAAGADFIATGHYARIDQVNGHYRLRRAVDLAKDQSYVLFGIGRDMLPRTLFPIGGMVKEQVREHARRLGLAVSDKPDSVDICFAPDRDYARVVRERRPEAFAEGPILDANGKEVGRHSGIPNYTIGQRRGLGIALGEPAYVTDIDVENGIVRVGGREELARSELTTSSVQWLLDPPADRFRGDVKIRYMHRPAPATLEIPGDARVRVHFDQPQFAPTPGQAAVFYQGDIVIGGGWID